MKYFTIATFIVLYFLGLPYFCVVATKHTLPLEHPTQAKQEITILSQTIEAEHPELFAYLATAHANQHLEHQLAKLKEALAGSWQLGRYTARAKCQENCN